MPIVVLIDALAIGHHGTYMRLFSKSLLALDSRVLAFGPDPGGLLDWVRRHCSSSADRFSAFAIQEPQRMGRLPGSVRGSWMTAARWLLAARAVRQARKACGQSPDLVFFPWLDSYLRSLSGATLWGLRRVFRHPWAGLYFHPKHLRLPAMQPGRTDPVVLERLLQAPNCRAVAVLDEGIAEQLAARIGGKPVIRFPDVADDTKPNRSAPVLQAIAVRSLGRPIIGLIGSLEKRKGMLTLLEVARQSGAQDWFFLFAGELVRDSFSAAELELIDTSRASLTNCWFHLRRVPDGAEFNALVDCCALLYLGYWGFPHSSNLLSKAAIFRKPVIVSDGFCMAERARQYSLGLCIEEGNAAQCLAAVRSLLERPIEADHRAYLGQHSEQRLLQSFEQLLAASADHGH